MRDLDATVGRLRAALVRQGALEDTLIVLVSDHGAAPVHTHLDLAEWFDGTACRRSPIRSSGLARHAVR